MSMLYEPLFNTVVVEIDDKEAGWGGSKDESAGLLGASYNKGTLRAVAMELFPFGDVSRVSESGLQQIGDRIVSMIGQQILWNKGHEGDNIFEQDGRKYAIIFWWDILGVALPSDVTYSDPSHAANSSSSASPHGDESLGKDFNTKPIDVAINTNTQETKYRFDSDHSALKCTRSKEDDIQATRQTLKKNGVPGWETINIEGGGHENGHITGVR